MAAPSTNPRQRRVPRLATFLIIATALACGLAIAFRTQIRSRYWAARILTTTNPAENAAYLTLLCNAGDAGSWGVETLLSNAEPIARQHGVIVLQHVNTARSRGRLYDLLTDADPEVAELAALGLAIHGDESVIPRLRALFTDGSADAVRVACLALGRLATPAAIETLSQLAEMQHNVQRAGALVDALDDAGTAAAVPALLTFLSDDREYAMPTRRDMLSSRVLHELMGQQGAPPEALLGHADERESLDTIASRAAEALGRITDIRQPYTTSMPATARDAARAAWQAWYDALRPGGQPQ